jgi:hypothetical protein
MKTIEARFRGASGDAGYFDTAHPADPLVLRMERAGLVVGDLVVIMSLDEFERLGKTAPKRASADEILSSVFECCGDSLCDGCRQDVLSTAT